MTDLGLLPWIGFNVFVLAMLALDLGVFHRKAHVVGLREAVGWSIFWIVLAMAFCLGIYSLWPDQTGGYTSSQAATAFLTGYVIEKSLSVDNLFVFAVLFTYFGVPSLYQQHRRSSVELPISHHARRWRARFGYCRGTR